MSDGSDQEIARLMANVANGTLVIDPNPPLDTGWGVLDDEFPEVDDEWHIDISNVGLLPQQQTKAREVCNEFSHLMRGIAAGRIHNCVMPEYCATYATMTCLHMDLSWSNTSRMALTGPSVRQMQARMRYLGAKAYRPRDSAFLEAFKNEIAASDIAARPPSATQFKAKAKPKAKGWFSW